MLAQSAGRIGDRPAGIDNVVNEQYRPPGKIGRHIAEKLHGPAGLLCKTVARQPHEFDLEAGARTVERADEVGDKHPCTLEHADHDEIGRERARDLRGQRIDPCGDLRSAEQNAHPTQRYFALLYRKKAGTVVATRIAPDSPSKPSTTRRKPVSVKLR